MKHCHCAKKTQHPLQKKKELPFLSVLECLPSVPTMAQDRLPSCSISQLLLAAMLLMSCSTVLAGARHLLQEPLPKIPELPKPELPPLPDLPKPELPTLPKPELPPLPEIPTLPKPEIPTVPNPEMPKLPTLPHLPDLPKPPVPTIPTLPKDIPMIPTHSSNNP